MLGCRSKRTQNQKRQRVQSAEPFAKRKKDEVVAEPNESEAGEGTKITDLNADCLEHIFKQLELKDLLNVADSRKSFTEAVEQAFTSKYGRRDIEFNIPSYFEIEESGKEIKIYDFVAALKFLRCFGKFTFTLKLEYGNLRRKRRLEFDRYLNDYCTETLKDLTFFYAPKGAIAGLKLPFTNVEKLHFYAGALGKKLSDFNRWFPNMQYLELDCIRSVNDSKCIEVHLPHLIHLEIRSYLFQSENVANFFGVNPQLQTMRVYSTANFPSVLKSASELLPHLEELHIKPCANDFFNMKEVIHFRNVKKFGLKYYQRLSKLPLLFEQLVELKLKQVGGLPPSGIIHEYIGMHPSVKKMNIEFGFEKMSEDWKKKLKQIWEAWSFGHGWRAYFKFGYFWHNMEFERIN